MSRSPGAELLAALRGVLPEIPGIAVIHSSFSSLMPPRGFRPFDALFAIDQLARDGWTVALPAFTFSFCGGRPFETARAPSEVGPLADWALAGLPAVRRTAHPIYSFVVIGPRAEEIAAMQPQTTFGPGSPFEFFENQDAQLVMLGCGWHFCTQFHRYEEMAEVPYRFFKTFRGDVDAGDGWRSTDAPMFVRDLVVNAENDFAPAVAELRAGAAIASTELWRGRIETAATSDLATVCQRQLAADPLAHARNRAQVAAALSRLRERDSQPELKVAVLGRSNVDLLRNAVEVAVAEHVPDRRVAAFAVPYGQLDQLLLAPRSELADFAADFTMFADRLEDLAAADSLDGTDAERLREQVAAHADAIARYRETARGWLFVCRFAPLTPTGGTPAESAGLIEEMNRILVERLEGLGQLAWIDVAHEAALAAAPAADARLWHLGRLPFSQLLSTHLARRMSGLVLAAMGRTARVVVLDLDNTLWGGVLGEDGIDGIRLGGDYPGNAFKAFQRALKRVSARGIGLAVASKNDADLALKAIDGHPEMEIRSADLVAHRIDWNPKSENVLAICEELNLGLGSCLFVDDNPVEREAVRRSLPDVKTLELPADPAEYAAALLASPWLTVIDVTAEDRKRIDSYRARAAIEQQRVSAISLEDFYASLGMVLFLQPLDDGNLARAAQLCMKTNQFNTTTRRYDGGELKAIAVDGADVVVVGLSGKTSQRENIGLLVLRPHPHLADTGLVDLYLLSCRVLGRGLETAVLEWAVGRARERRWSELRGEIIETERNTPVRSAFANAGFERDGGSGEWRRATASGTALPAWLKVEDSMPAAADPVALR